MNRTTSPGIGQWLTVSLMVAVSIFLLVKLYQYAGFRQYYPVGLTVAGVDIGGMSREEASELLSNRYLDAPVVIYHGEQPFEISPSQAKFVLDRETMLSQADYQRTQQDFWAGFWGFLWGRPVEVAPVPLAATHDREALREVLDEIAILSDQPSQPPQPVPVTLSFQYGEAGTQTNIEASFADVEAALYRPANREARLIVEPGQVVRPQINLLSRLLVNHLQDFLQTVNGVASVFIVDLASGEEIAINADVAMSGLDLLKVPLVIEAYRVLDGRPTIAQQQLISETLTQPENLSANDLLRLVAGQDDPYLGAKIVTESMQRLGLQNTFITAPYDADGRLATIETPANSVEGLLTQPTPQMQTTAEDMGILLSMLYYCTQDGGTLLAAFPDELTPSECEAIITAMMGNRADSLLEDGIPPETAVAHRHGWISDTHGDAGVVFTDGGDYVIVTMLYKPNWLEWEISSPLIADISRATYNYFNFDAPYLSDSPIN